MTNQAEADFWQIVRGADEPPAPTRQLRAGPVTAVLDGIEVRNLRLGDLELARRIYVAVRNPLWSTVAGVVRDLVIDEGGAGFKVGFDVDHDEGELVFSWRGLITGDSHGVVTYSMAGRAGRDLVYNRIGICLLLPPEMAGRPLRANEEGTLWRGQLPDDIGPQTSENGVLLALHPATDRLEVDLRSGGTFVLNFSGDLFETEDQRNWTDASFKVYSTPLTLGIPRRSKAGASIDQLVTLSLEGAPRVSVDAGPPRLEIGEPTGTHVPRIGLGLASHPPSHSPAQLGLLAALGPAHLRLDCHLDSPTWASELAEALRVCGAVGSQLELALFSVPQSAGLEELATVVAGAPVARVLVFAEGAVTNSPQETSPGELLARVRVALGDYPIVGGTDLNFCELNRTRPDFDAIDGVAWPMNPQVHAFDDASVLETPQAQAMQVATAHRFAPGKRLYVGPITLLPRYNPNLATDTSPSPSDPRQATLFGAAFTLASLKYLSESGTDAVTYYETVGRRGTIAAEKGPHGVAGVFPLFHPLADAAELAGSEVLRLSSSQPLTVTGMAARRGNLTTLFIANMTPASTVAELAGGRRHGTIRRLNAYSAATASLEPEAFRTSLGIFEGEGLSLEPYETVRVDLPTDREN